MTTKSSIAQALGVTQQQVSRWAKRGMPVYDIAAARAWHAAHIRTRQRRKAAVVPSVPAAEPGGDPPTRTWYDKRQRVLTLHAQHELDLLEGKVLLATGVRDALAKKLGSARDRLLGIPSRIAPQFPDGIRQRVYDLIEDEIRLALTEISGVPE